MVCTESMSGGKCEKLSKPGYYFNSGSSSSNKLIYCEGDVDDYEYNYCEIIEMENGYFRNSDNTDVIECKSSNCEVITNEYSCKGRFTVIEDYKTHELGYCTDINKKPKSFPSDSRYYKVTDIKAEKSTYPILVSGGIDYILLKVDAYSITQESSISTYCINKK